MKTKIEKAKKFVIVKSADLLGDKKGLEQTNWIVGALIAIIVGGVILTVISGHVPGVLQKLLDKINSIFSL